MKGAKRYWVLALLFGVAAAVLVYRYTEDVKERYEPKNLVDVVVAAANIPKNSIILREQLKLERIPAQYAHPLAIRDIKEVVGQTAVADISQGEQVLSNRLVSGRAKRDKLAYIVPQGKRAVSVAVNPVSGVSGLIRPGDRVDVLATLEVPSGQEQVTMTAFALQDVEVLAVDQSLSETKPTSGKEETVQTKTVTLAVSPEEARRLVLASERGSIRLALRSPADRERISLPPLRVVDIVGGQ